MTPVNIVRRAIEVGLNVLAITDHNQTGPLEETVRAGSGAGVLVLPGAELATSGGHVLAPFAPAKHYKVGFLLVKLGIENPNAIQQRVQQRC
jgi:predicted metal-dependent phosphoesterase TrpH